MYDSHDIIQLEFDNLLNVLKCLNLCFCITEEYNNSLALIENKLNTNINKDIVLYRQNLYKKERDCTWKNVKYEFENNNKYDIQLYTFWKKNHDKQISKLKKITNFSFHDNIYHSLLLYTNLPLNRCPLSIFNPTSNFVQKYTKELVVINNLSRNNCGKQFAINWIQYFSKYFKIHIDIDLSDPLHNIKYIASLNNFK